MLTKDTFVISNDCSAGTLTLRGNHGGHNHPFVYARQEKEGFYKLLDNLQTIDLHNICVEMSIRYAHISKYE